MSFNDLLGMKVSELDMLQFHECVCMYVIINYFPIICISYLLLHNYQHIYAISVQSCIQQRANKGKLLYYLHYYNAKNKLMEMHILFPSHFWHQKIQSLYFLKAQFIIPITKCTWFYLLMKSQILKQTHIHKLLLILFFTHGFGLTESLLLMLHQTKYLTLQEFTSSILPFHNHTLNWCLLLGLL
jgi:hypothetical protein